MGHSPKSFNIQTIPILVKSNITSNFSPYPPIS